MPKLALRPRPIDVEPIRLLHNLPELMTRDELSAFSQVAVQTFKRWAVDGKGPRITKLGSTVRYRKADVVAWMNDAAA